MDPEPRILDLMVKWDEARERGARLRPEDLTADPAEQAELRKRIARVEAAESVGGKAPVVGDRPFTAPRIEGYDSYELIGYGGMGVVWRAQEPKAANRIVAIKMLLAGPAAEPLNRRRFSQELEAVSLLGHSNIVKVLTHGDHRGQLYLVMEYIEGGDLKGWRDAQASADNREYQQKAAGVIAAAAHAVDHAHTRGVVHRDIKPANILLRGDGTPVISDFGLAKIDPEIAPLFGMREQLTEADMTPGTPAYMAPEQARGDRVLTPLVDVWSLGVVLYELLTGRLPFHGDTVFNLLTSIAGPDPAPLLRKVEPRVSRDLEVICLKCLEKEAGRRYRTAGELADDLDRWLEGRPIRARPVSRPERAVMWARRRPAIATLWAALVVVAGVGAGVAGWYSNENRRTADDLSKANGELSTTVTRLEKERDTVKSLNGELQRKIDQDALLKDTFHYADNLSTAKRLWDMGRAREARGCLSLCRWNLRGWEHALLRREFDESSLLLQGHTGAVTSIQFSPDGRRLATASLDGTLRLWDATTFRQVLSLAIPKNTWRGFGSVCFSPDGRSVAGGSMGWGSSHLGKVILWDSASGRQLLELEAPHSCVHTLSFSPDGRRLIGAVSNGAETAGAIVVWDAETGGQLHTLQGDGRGFVAACFSPDGRKFAAAATDSNVTLWDIRGKEEYTVEGGGRFVCFSPDGSRLAMGGGARNGLRDSNVVVADAGSGVRLLTIKGHGGGLTSLAYGPDGMRLCGGSTAGVVHLWDAQTGDEIQSLIGHERDVSCVCFSADGRLLASAASLDWRDTTGEIRIWDVDTSHDTLTIRTLGRQYGGCVSPDGGRVACACGDGTVRVLDARSGREHFAIKAAFTTAISLCFSPDGGSLAVSWETHSAVYDASTGRRRFELTGGGGITTAEICYSPDGTRLATAHQGTVGQNGIQAGPVVIWDAATGRPIHTLAGHNTWVYGVCFSPSGKHVASMDVWGVLRCWDAATGEARWVIEREPTQRTRRTQLLADGGPTVCYTLDGEHVISAGDGGVATIREATTGKAVLHLKGGAGDITKICVSPDGRRIVGGTEAGTLEVWDAVTGYKLLTLRAHRDVVSGLGFCRDGSCLVSTSFDGTARVWRFAQSQVIVEIAAPADPDNPVVAIGFSNDGNRVVARYRNDFVGAWIASTGEYQYPCVDPPPQGTQLQATSGDGEWQAWVQNGSVLSRRVSDRRPSPEAVVAARLNDSSLQAGWHRRSVNAAEQAGQWFAVAHHLGLLHDLVSAGESRASLRLRTARAAGTDEVVTPLGESPADLRVRRLRALALWSTADATLADAVAAFPVEDTVETEYLLAAAYHLMERPPHSPTRRLVTDVHSPSLAILRAAAARHLRDRSDPR